MTIRKYEVKRARAGLGLFAATTFTRGELIIEYTGERITEAEANRRGGKYLFELNDKYTIDGKGRTNTARYINHACKPNAYPELNSSETRVRIYAKRRIAPGEEITYHYGKDYFERVIKPLGCRCPHCSPLATQP